MAPTKLKYLLQLSLCHLNLLQSPLTPTHLCSKTTKSSLTNLVDLYRELTGLMSAVGASYRDDSNAFFQNISHKVLIDKLVRYG